MKYLCKFLSFSRTRMKHHLAQSQRYSTSHSTVTTLSIMTHCVHTQLQQSAKNDIQNKIAHNINSECHNAGCHNLYSYAVCYSTITVTQEDTRLLDDKERMREGLTTRKSSSIIVTSISFD
jgi:hypothetical protein